MQIVKTKLEAVLKSQPHEYQVIFKKKDQTVRRMLCLNDVPSQKGGENKVERTSNNYMTVFDTEKKAFRTVNLASVISGRLADGSEFTVV